MYFNNYPVPGTTLFYLRKQIKMFSNTQFGDDEKESNRDVAFLESRGRRQLNLATAHSSRDQACGQAGS